LLLSFPPSLLFVSLWPIVLSFLFSLAFLPSFLPPCLTTCLSNSRVFLQKLTVTQLLKIFPTVYGIWRFITVFTTTHHWFLSWARYIQSTSSHPISVTSILILSSHLRLGFPSGVFPSFLYPLLSLNTRMKVSSAQFLHDLPASLCSETAFGTPSTN
jgi:hypothetical protein